MPYPVDERMLTERERMIQRRRGVWADAVAGVRPGRYYNPGREAGKIPQSAGEVGPNYYDQIAGQNWDQIDRNFPTLQGADPRLIEAAIRRRDAAQQQFPTIQAPVYPASAWPSLGAGGMNMPRSGLAGGGIPEIGGPTQAWGPGPNVVSTDMREGFVFDTIVARRKAERLQKEKQTPQEKVQNWADTNTAVQSEIIPPGQKSAIAPSFNMFGGGGHMDTVLLDLGPEGVDKTTWQNYKMLIKDADERLSVALAGRSSMPHTIEEAKSLANSLTESLGLDDRIGEHVERFISRYIQKSNPKLYNQIIGQKEVDEANMREPGSYELDPISLKPVLTPAGQAAREHQAMLTSDLLNQQVLQAKAQTSGGQLRVHYRSGKPELESVEEVEEKQQQKIQAIKDKQEKNLEGIYKTLTDRITRINEAKMAGRIDKQQANIMIARDEKLLPQIEDRLNQLRGIPETPATTPAETPMQVALRNQLQRLVLVNQSQIKKLTTALQRADLNPDERQAIQSKLSQLQSPPAATPVAPITPVASSAPTPATINRRAELLEQAPSFDESDIANFVGRSIKSGVMNLADIVKSAGVKSIKTNLDIATFPLKVAELEAKLGRSAWNRIMIAMEDKMREEWVEQQLKKEAGQ